MAFDANALVKLRMPPSYDDDGDLYYPPFNFQIGDSHYSIDQTTGVVMVKHDHVPQAVNLGLERA